MKIWGYWATLGWAVLALVVGQIAGAAAFIWWRATSVNAVMATPYDGVFLTFTVLIGNPILIAVLALAIRFARADFFAYLALIPPPRRALALGIAALVGLIAIGDAIVYFSGHALVPPFEVQSFTTAAAQGWLTAMLVAAIIVAPAGEEIMFRGFLFRGWVRSQRTVWPAIVVISALWASLHVQYDWIGIAQIFIVGLFLGWMRWRSGSTLLTFLLHALFNLEATMETVLQLHFFR